MSTSTSNHNSTTPTIGRIIKAVSMALLAFAMIVSTAGAAAAAPKGGGGNGGDKGGPKNGGISVSYDPEGDLIVTGDDNNNDVILGDAVGGYEIKITTGGVTAVYEVGYVTGDIIFDLAGGDDTIYFNQESSWRLDGNAHIDLGDGRNKVHGQTGFDTYEDITFIDGSGASELELKNHHAGYLSLDLGGGNDSLRLTYSEVDHNVDIQAGAGDDYMYMFDVETNQSFSYRGGKGDDQLHIWASTFLGSTTLNGGQHTDWLAGEANTFASSPSVSAFEIIG